MVTSYSSYSPIWEASLAVVPASLRRSLPASTTSWRPGSTPLSTPTSACLAIVAYLATIFGGRHLMRSRPAFKHELKWPFFFHNVALSLGSLWLLALMLEEVRPIWLRFGTWDTMCGPKAWTERIETFYIFNYYFKYVELLDTCFMVLKKKPLAFLHVYHHAATALLCLSQLMGKTSISWLVISLNLAVHVLMYAYYALTSVGIRVPWKKAVTIAQITQFVIDLFVVYTATWSHFALLRFGLPKLSLGDCAGEEYAAIAGCLILTSYLFLFLAFYNRTYLQKKVAGVQRSVAANGKKAVATANGHYANGGAAAKKHA